MIDSESEEMRLLLRYGRLCWLYDMMLVVDEGWEEEMIC